MSWLVLSYSLPSKERSSPRVALWRRLNRLGAVSVRSGVHILPDREDCGEAFNWLAEEVRQKKGDCLVMKVESFAGLCDQELAQLFRQNSDKAYQEIERQASDLEKKTSSELSGEEHRRLHSEIGKLRKKQGEIARTDFFDAPGGARITSRLASMERALFSKREKPPSIPKATISHYQNRRWVTRARPHVDRLGCAWLIRRFIDRQPKIRYSNNPEPDEIAFDLKQGGTFRHVGDLSTFETMLSAFDLKETGLGKLAEIIHEIDLRDGRYLHPETAGIDAILRGWLLKGLSDEELDTHGMALFDGLYSDVLQQEAHRETLSKALKTGSKTGNKKSGLL